MLNKVILMGRITQDLEVKQTQSGASVLSFTVAVQRSFARQGEERQTDFINCVAWRNTAEFIGRYFRKGRMIAIEGNLRTRTYDDKNGVKHYVTEVFVDNASFTGEKTEGGYQQNDYNNSYAQPQTAPQNNYNNAPSNDDLSIGDMADFEVLSDDGVPF
ncbi:MAG: single-stranded DNA-binding protein [Ruminococcus sp.]|nr:single-stranded DNA-binding protein [Ruminococcus sp.]